MKSDGPLPDMDGFFWPITVGDSVYGVTQTTDPDMTIHRVVVAVDARPATSGGAPSSPTARRSVRRRATARW